MVTLRHWVLSEPSSSNKRTLTSVQYASFEDYKTISYFDNSGIVTHETSKAQKPVTFDLTVFNMMFYLM